MVRTVVHNPSRTEYECADCGERFDERRDTCDSPFCDGEVRNVAVSRE
jgi:DNA-directed RNA polymerase subunit RPC12/RpoP